MDKTTQPKETMEQFGARIRGKYPEYLKYSNKEIAQKMIVKYPQYATNVSDIEQPKQESFLTKAGKTVAGFFTGETQKLGKTLGQIGATEDVTQSLNKSEQLAGGVEANLIKQIRLAKSQGRDTSKLEKELVSISGRQRPGQLTKEIIPGALKSNRQVIGEVVGTATEALQGGAISGTRGLGLAKIAPTAEKAAISKAQYLAKPLSGRLKQIGTETVKDIASILPFGYSYDVAQNLQNDKTGMEAFKPGMATIMSTVIPLGLGTIRAGRQITADTLSNVVAPNLSGVQAEAYKRLRTGDVDFKNAPTPQKALEDARISATAFKQAVQEEFGEGQEKLITEMTGKRIGITESEKVKLQKIAERFGFSDRLPQNPQNMSVKETMDLVKEINSIKPISQLDDPLIMNLKLSLMDIKKSIMERAGSNEGFTNKFSTIYKNYSTKQKMLKDIQSVIGKIGTSQNGTRLALNPTQTQTATSRLQRIFQENGTEYLKAIKQLELETGENILDKVAASQLANILPKTLRTAPAGLGGIMNDVVSAVTIPLSSPRFSAFLISQIGGYGRGAVTKLLNANPKIRKAIYDAVHKENMKFSDAVELYAIDYIKNPKMGASIQDVSKNQLNNQNISANNGKITQTNTKIPTNIAIDTNSTTNTIKSQAYKGEKDLTTKILKDLEGKTTVSKQYILDATNRGELKQVERDITRQVLEDMTRNKEPLISIPQIKSKYPKLEFGIYENPSEITLSKIVVPKAERGGGVGTSAMNDLVKYADQSGKKIVLTPSTDYGGSSVSRLKDFYKKFGFVENAGKNKDFSTRESMFRLPQKTYSSDTINVKEFADKVKSELLPLEAKTSGSSIQRNKTSEDYLMTPRYENISLPSELRGKIKDYRERIYNSPIETSAGKTHFGSNARDTAKNYFGHTRIEDMADNKTRRVIEVQSDLYQKGNLEKEGDNFSKENLKKLGSDTGLGVFNKSDPFNYKKMDISTLKVGDIVGEKYGKQYKVNKILNDSDIKVQELYRGNGVKEFDFKKYTVAPEEYQLNTKVGGDANQRSIQASSYQNKISQREQEISKLQQYNDPTAHFRMVREEIKKASQDGKTKLQFPTGETAMKIEGLGSQSDWVAVDFSQYNTPQRIVNRTTLKPDTLKVGMDIQQGGVTGGGQRWIITDVLGDGKFKAVPKDNIIGWSSEKELYEQLDNSKNFSEVKGNKYLEDVMDDIFDRKMEADDLFAKYDYDKVSDELQNQYVKTIKDNHKEAFDISGKVDTNNPIYKFYEKEMQKYLNKFGGTKVVDDKGVSWIEVQIKKEWAKMPVEAFAIIGAVGLASQNNNK